MASKLDIINQSLSHLAISSEVNNFDTERTKEAQAARRFWDQARDEVLREFSWPFATRFGAMSPIANDPTTEWQYSFTPPTDAINIHRILDDVSRHETETSRVPHRIAWRETGPIVYTDHANAVVEYTYKVTNTEIYPPDFVDALSLLLAFKMGPRVAGGDQFKLADRAYQLYLRAIAKAKANAAREISADIVPPDAEMIRARG